MNYAEKKSVHGEMEAESRFHRFFHTNRSPMLLIDPDTGQIVDANGAVCSFCGYPQEEVIGRKMTDLDISAVDPCSDTEAGSQICDCLSRVCCHSKNGQSFELEVFIWPVIFRDKCLTVMVLHDVIDRTRADQVLAKAKYFYLNLFDVSPALIWRTDSAGQFVYFNRNWLALSGLTVEEEMACQWTDRIHPTDRDNFLRVFHGALSNRTAFDMDYRLCRSDGQYRWIETIGKPFWDEENNFAGYIGYCHDKTEQYEMEDILRKLSRAVEQSTSAIVITDTEGCIEYANRSYTRMTGYGLEEIVGSNPRLATGLPDLFGEAWETVKNGREWRGEIHNHKKNGDCYWEFATFSPIANTEDMVTHYLAQKEDITARKTAEKELEQSRAELCAKHQELQYAYEQVAQSKKEWEGTMDCIGDMVVLIDSNGTIRRCNKALKRFTGQEYDMIIGKDCREFLCQNGLNFPDDHSSGAEVQHQESGRWFFCRSYPFTTSENSAVSGAVMTIHDFTEQKRVNAELEKVCSDLKTTQATVVQQEKMATIGLLAAGVAHEINNPMGFVSSNLGMLGKYLDRLTEFLQAQAEVIERLNDEESIRLLNEKAAALKIDRILKDGRELIEESLEGAGRVRTIVQNLKGFARIDEAACKPADINECIESTINIVWNELKYKVKLTRELGELPLTRCYPQQLNQVFMNLLVNAGQAIENAGEIVVKTWQEDPSIFVSISDTGCGIPAEAIEHIFEPFFTTKEVGKGTGLGLSIIYDIVKSHKGDITVDSEPGKGTTFTVRIPVQ